MRTRVKICGFTQVQDAQKAALLGVDAIGLVFYPPSPRYVSIEQAAEISRALPAFVNVVALFVDAEESYIRKVLAKAPIDCIQFHGDEAAENCRIYQKPYMKAVRMQADTSIAELEQEYSDASALLLDAYHPDLKGGSGRQFDWELIPQQCQLPIVLAGGLSVGNVELAIGSVKPYAVDVSSGVEVAKGIKDTRKMAEFIHKTNSLV